MSLTPASSASFTIRGRGVRPRPRTSSVCHVPMPTISCDARPAQLPGLHHLDRRICATPETGTGCQDRGYTRRATPCGGVRRRAVPSPIRRRRVGRGTRSRQGTTGRSTPLSAGRDTRGAASIAGGAAAFPPDGAPSRQTRTERPFPAPICLSPSDRCDSRRRAAFTIRRSEALAAPRSRRSQSRASPKQSVDSSLANSSHLRGLLTAVAVMAALCALALILAPAARTAPAHDIAVDFDCAGGTYGRSDRHVQRQGDPTRGRGDLSPTGTSAATGRSTPAPRRRAGRTPSRPW